jgi:hypothetical protein
MIVINIDAALQIKSIETYAVSAIKVNRDAGGHNGLPYLIKCCTPGT